MEVEYLEKFCIWCIDNGFVSSLDRFFSFLDNSGSEFLPRKVHVIGLFREYIITHSWWNRKENESLIQNTIRKDVIMKYLKKLLLHTEANDCFDALKEIIAIVDGYKEIPESLLKGENKSEFS